MHDTIRNTAQISVFIRFFLHTKVYKDGRSAIYVRVHGASPAPLIMSTGESVLREAWNHEGQKVSGRKERYATEINARLDRITHRVASEFRERLIRHGINVSKSKGGSR